MTVIISTNIALSQYRVKTINFLNIPDLKYNAAGPMLLKVDDFRNSIYVVNTLSSSVSIIDGKTDKVTNIPVGGRGFQHLKNSALTFNRKSGLVYVIGKNSLLIVDPAKKSAKSIDTKKQFESIAVDDRSGNIFLTGRESSKLGFYDAKTQKFELKPWLSEETKLENQNQTPPPAIRKIVSTNDYKSNMIAIDGYTSTLYILNGNDASIIKQRKLPLGDNDGRWHLAGYNIFSKYIYLATETKHRKIDEVAKIDVFGNNDKVVKLPKGFSEPVGIIYNPNLDEVYIPYDNNAFVHAVNFKDNGKITAIEIPAYGNDGSVLDVNNNLLYVSSWAHGEIEVIDLKTKKFKKKIEHLGIIPHMFAIAFNRANGAIYFPKGASAVNGNFGAAITKLIPNTEKTKKIYLGWAPIDLIEMKDRNSVFVFNNEDQFAEIKYGGSYKYYTLPYSFPICATHSPEGNIYLSYGPHQSYWPNVYIWGAKNGVITINKKNLHLYDRRIPRQAMKMIMDKKGILYLEQNNWGKGEQFINRLLDEVRYYESGQRIRLSDTVERENTQRIMEYDSSLNLIYLVRVGEKDDEPSILQIINIDSNKVVKRIELEKIATDLLFDDNYIYVTNFGSNSVSMIDKKSYAVANLKAGIGPIKLRKIGGKIFVLNQLSNDIKEIKISSVNSGDFSFKIPFNVYPDNFFVWNENLVITGFNKSEFHIILFNTKTKEFKKIFSIVYPYGDTRFDTSNASFYEKGIFGDVVFNLTKGLIDKDGKFWISDFLGGKVYIINKTK